MAPFIFGVVGWPIIGKVNLLDALMPELRRRGYRIGSLRPYPEGATAGETGIWRYQLDGAASALFMVPGRMAPEREGDWQELEQWSEMVGGVDLILAEGFPGAHWPKLEVYEGTRGPLLSHGDPWLVAVVGHIKPRYCPVPFFMPDEIERIVDMMEATRSLGSVARR